MLTKLLSDVLASHEVSCYCIETYDCTDCTDCTDICTLNGSTICSISMLTYVQVFQWYDTGATLGLCRASSTAVVLLSHYVLEIGLALPVVSRSETGRVKYISYNINCICMYI